MLGRIRNLLAGFFGLFVKRLEERNPGAVYESVIQQRGKQFERIKENVAGVMVQRDRIQERIETKRKEIDGIDATLKVLVDDSTKDEEALDLIERKDAAEEEIAELLPEVECVDEQIADGKAVLREVQTQIERLKDEKARVLTMKAVAEHRIRMQRQVGGLPADTDMKALEHVREHVKRLRQEQRLLKELSADSTAKLIEIGEAETRRSAAKAKLAQMRGARA